MLSAYFIVPATSIPPTAFNDLIGLCSSTKVKIMVNKIDLHGGYEPHEGSVAVEKALTNDD
jgi:hypothetical protein